MNPEEEFQIRVETLRQLEEIAKSLKRLEVLADQAEMHIEENGFQ